MRKLVFLTLVLALLAPLVTAVALQVTTSKTTYLLGEEVVIVVSAPPGTVVGVEVRDPYGNVCYVDQVTADSTGKAVTSFHLGAKWPTGVYTVYVAAYKIGVAKTTFTVKTSTTVTDNTGDTTTTQEGVVAVVDIVGVKLTSQQLGLTAKTPIKQI